MNPVIRCQSRSRPVCNKGQSQVVDICIHSPRSIHECCRHAQFELELVEVALSVSFTEAFLSEFDKMLVRVSGQKNCLTHL